MILIDDGSTDGGAEFAQDIDDRRVRVIGGGESKGLASRLNQIAREAQGVYVARMDADDIAVPERFALQLEYLRQHPSVDVVGTNCYIMDEKGSIVGGRDCPEDHADIFRHAVGQMSVPIIHPTIMARRDWFLENPYDERARRSQDFELWMRTRSTSRFATLPLRLLYYRQGHAMRLRNVLYSKVNSVRYLWRHGKGEVGAAVMARCIARQIAAVFAYSVAFAVGHEQGIVRRRPMTALSIRELRSAERRLDEVRAFAVPRKGTSILDADAER